MALLDKKLTKEWAEEVINEDNKLVLAIIHDLQQKAKEIADELGLEDLEDMGWLFNELDEGKSPFNKLEGDTERDGNIVVLKQCPMTRLLKEVSVDGKLPDYYQAIVEKYIQIYKNKGAILHPFCIVHQVIRAHVGEHIKVGGKMLSVYQVACRSMTSGKIVYANEGLSKVDMTKEEVDAKLEGKACMYLLK